MPSEEMVFMKRMIFPFLIKVRPSLRDSAFSLRFPAENFRTAKFSAGKTLRKRRDGRKRDSEGENCDRRSACATKKISVPEPPFMPGTAMKHETTRLFRYGGRLSSSLCIACGRVLQRGPLPASCGRVHPIPVPPVNDRHPLPCPGGEKHMPYNPVPYAPQRALIINGA